MKKTAILVLLTLLFCTAAVWAEDFAVTVNGDTIEFDVGPRIISGKVMIPMRFVFEKLGAAVMYDDETETKSSYCADTGGGARIITIQIGNSKAFINNDTYDLDAAPVLVDDRTLVTPEFIENALEAKVVIDVQENSIGIINIEG